MKPDCGWHIKTGYALVQWELQSDKHEMGWEVVNAIYQVITPHYGFIGVSDLRRLNERVPRVRRSALGFFHPFHELQNQSPMGGDHVHGPAEGILGVLWAIAYGLCRVVICLTAEPGVNISLAEANLRLYDTCCLKPYH